MKSYTEIEKKLKSEEIAEGLVFPGPTDKRERESILEDFRQIRKELAAKQSEDSKQINRLLQLKFIIEDYLQSNELKKDFFFGFFLKEYIVCLELKNVDFAKEIKVNPTELSQVIRRRRKPSDRLIYRLDIHSNRNFPATTWFGILEKERAYDLVHDKSIIENEKKFVKRKLAYSL